VVAVTDGGEEMHNECGRCGDPVLEYETCYECEQEYYPPRQYWQLDDVQAEADEVLSAL
jgi:hypothetical protein